MKKILSTVALFALLGAGCSQVTKPEVNGNAGSTGTERSAQNNASVTGTEMRDEHAQGVPNKSATGTEESTSNANANADLGASAGSAGEKDGVRTRMTVRDSIKGFAFNPDTITVTKGDAIIFTNSDSVPHTVTADGGAFASATLSQGDSFTLDTSSLSAGTYPFHCSIHPSMTGTVIVK